MWQRRLGLLSRHGAVHASGLASMTNCRRSDSSGRALRRPAQRWPTPRLLWRPARSLVTRSWLPTSTSLAMCHLWRGELDEAERGLQASLKLAERLGYVRRPGGRSRPTCPVYRMRGQIELVKAYLPRALETAQSSDLPAYLGMAHCHLAWVAWREGRLADVQTHGAAALEAWRRHLSPLGALAPLPAAGGGGRAGAGCRGD